MYEILLKNHKSIKLNSKQFQFLKIIGQLGFLNYSQLTMLWSVVKRTYSNFSHSMLKKMDYSISAAEDSTCSETHTI